MNDRTEKNDNQQSRPAQLTALEARLPIPDDVLVVEADDLPWPGPLGVWSPSRRVILLRSDLGDQRAFTLAHELAHCLLGHESTTRDAEAQADAYAARLLREAGVA